MRCLTTKSEICAVRAAGLTGMVPLEHDPEKCEAVFRQHHAQSKDLERDGQSTSSHRALGPDEMRSNCCYDGSALPLPRLAQRNWLSGASRQRRPTRRANQSSVRHVARHRTLMLLQRSTTLQTSTSLRNARSRQATMPRGAVDRIGHCQGIGRPRQTGPSTKPLALLLKGACTVDGLCEISTTSCPG
jgi:hypothetical protein